MNKVGKVSVIDEVVHQIGELIRSGRYNPGEKLPTEDTFRVQLGVGRSTVREAIRILQAQGLVEIKPGRGAFVYNTDDYTAKMVREWFMEKETEIQELMEARLAIESAAISLVVSRVTDGSLDRIKAAHEDFKSAASGQDSPQLAALDESFHNAIIEAADNRYLSRIGHLIGDSLREYRKRSLSVEGSAFNALRSHDDLVKYIAERNEAAAIEALRKHVEISVKDMRAVLDRE